MDRDLNRLVSADLVIILEAKTLIIMTKVTIRIHHNTEKGVSPKIEEILGLLGSEIKDYQWIISDVEAVGEKSKQLMKKIQAVEYRPLIVSGDDIINLVGGIDQFIWGVFLALPKKSTSVVGDLCAEGAPASSFQVEDAIFEFRVVDGEFYECLFKNVKMALQYQGNFEGVLEVFQS